MYSVCPQQYLHYQESALVSINRSCSCFVWLVPASDPLSGIGMTLESVGSTALWSWVWAAVARSEACLCTGRTIMHGLSGGLPFAVFGLRLSRSYSSWAFCILRFFIFLLCKWKVVRETHMIPMITTTKMKSTTVDEKAWNKWSTRLMQVPLIWVVPFKEQCGIESAQFSDVLVPI